VRSEVPAGVYFGEPAAAGERAHPMSEHGDVLFFVVAPF
jgi:hypothetical protein